MPDQLLDPIAETQKLLGGLGRTKTLELIANGELESVKIGSRRLVVHESIERYIGRLAESQRAGDAA